MDNIEVYQQRIKELEFELDEMTVALSQTWDQLVPLLQQSPVTPTSSVDLISTLQTVIAALDAPLAGIFLLENQSWFCLPSETPLPMTLIEWLNNPAPSIYIADQIIWNGLQIQWLFMPIFPESQHVAGALGVGIAADQRQFTALDERILERLTERVANQMTAARLAKSREWEAQTLRDLQIANLIQRTIQPHSSPQLQGWEVAGIWKPAKAVGGDAWGWVMQPNGNLACFMLDVTGKGLPAALAAVALHTAFRITLRLGYNPIEALQIINAEFYEAYSQADLLATATVIALDPSTGEFDQANAGHPPTLIRRHQEWLSLPATAPPLGTLPDLVLKSQRVALHKDDLIICYSDGFSEIETGGGLWGQDGLIAQVTEPLYAHPTAVIQAITQATQGLQTTTGEAHDDQTLVVIMRQGEATLKTLTLAAELGELAQLTPLLEALLEDISNPIKIALTLAVQELCVNIIVHAYENTPGLIQVDMQREGDDLFLTFRDYAHNAYTLPQEITAPDPLDLPEGGWGIFLIYQAVDHVEYQRLSDGNWWRLYKNLEGNHVT